MATPEEEATVSQIVETVTTLLDAVLRSDRQAVEERLSPDSLVSAGLALFGLDAVVVPLGLAARPHHLGLTSVQAGDDLAVAELRGRDEQEQDVSVASVFLSLGDDEWLVEDIWPLPADGEFDLASISEPTALFYSGDLQLAVADDASLDEVEKVLVPGLQAGGLGLHMIERGVHLWRAFVDGQPIPPPAAGWAAGAHLAVLALDGQEPDPAMLSAQYGVPVETVADRFVEIATRLGLAPDADQPAPRPAAPSGLVDLSGRPIPPTGDPGDGRRDRGTGGIILPRG